jgi:hypothetical protein
MTTYSFTLILPSVDVLTPDMEDALERADCDDATMGSRCGVVSLTFDREAESRGKAIGLAIEDVEGRVQGRQDRDREACDGEVRPKTRAEPRSARRGMSPSITSARSRVLSPHRFREATSHL